MFTTARQRRVLDALRYGPLDRYRLAADIDEAEFALRAELGALRAAQLVRDIPLRDRIVWELTARGWAEVYTHDQLELGGHR